MNSSDIEIRKADTADIPAIQAIANVAFPATYTGIIPDGQIPYMMEWMYSTESLTRQMEEEKNQFYIANTGGEDAGYVSIRPDGEGIFHLEKIYVLPSHQGSHVGKALFRQAVKHVQAICPGARMQLNVNRNNKAVGFYRHMGMAVLKEVDNPIGDGYFMNDYIMDMVV